MILEYSPEQPPKTSKTEHFGVLWSKSSVCCLRGWTGGRGYGDRGCGIGGRGGGKRE